MRDRTAHRGISQMLFELIPFFLTRKSYIKVPVRITDHANSIID